MIDVTRPAHSPRFLVASSLLLLISSGCFHLLGYEFLPPDAPPARNAEVARSVWRSLSLQAPEFRALRDVFARESRAAHVAYRQDVFSIGRGGELYPKHSAISGIAAAPFYGLLGDFGFWLLQQVVALLLFHSTFRLTSILAGRDTGIETLLTVTILTETIVGLFCYDFSYDLHGVALLVCGLYLMYRRPFWGSALATLTVFVRPTYALLLPMLPLVWRKAPEQIGRLSSTFLGMGVVVSLYLVANDLLWGGPFVTAYDRVAAFGPTGEMFVEHHPHGFNAHVLLGDWGQKLFGRRVGLVTFNLALLALPWVLAWARCAPNATFALSTLAAGFVYALYAFSYELWDVSFIGNRFLLPTVYLYALSFIPWCSAQLRTPSTLRVRDVSGKDPVSQRRNG